MDYLNTDIQQTKSTKHGRLLKYDKIKVNNGLSW